jgi:hypothetical protein
MVVDEFQVVPDAPEVLPSYPAQPGYFDANDPREASVPKSCAMTRVQPEYASAPGREPEPEPEPSSAGADGAVLGCAVDVGATLGAAEHCSSRSGRATSRRQRSPRARSRSS